MFSCQHIGDNPCESDYADIEARSIPVPIDTSQVPQDKLTDARFLSLHAEIQGALNHLGYVNAFCIHEAGHMIYFSKAGFAEFDFHGPRIVYDSERDDFDGYPAAIQPKPYNIDFSNMDIQKWLSTVAQAHAAGGVFARKLANARDGGDEEDRQHFDNMCGVVQRQIPNIEIDREASWRGAQDAVLKDLRSPAFRTEAWNKARKIKERLFGVLI